MQLPVKLSSINKEWDIIIIGGGITGAGIFRQAVQEGLKVLLVEKDDYASKTSSSSSKLVHGGLRYLKEGKIFLTKASVLERERLMKEAPGLVTNLGFLMPVYKDRGTSKWLLRMGLSLYDVIAMKKRHQYFNKIEFIQQVPNIDQNGLLGGFLFFDAQVDDVRLVLRLIWESINDGGTALNYTEALQIVRDSSGNVQGINLKDVEKH